MHNLPLVCGYYVPIMVRRQKVNRFSFHGAKNVSDIDN